MSTRSIAKATPVLTWTNPSDITFGTALGATQLNASANVAGTFAYTPPAGTVLGVGSSQTLSTTFTPASAANYTAAGESVQINVKVASNSGSPAQIVITKLLARDSGTNQIVLTLNVSNSGGTTATSVQITNAKLNTTAGTSLPQALGAISPGGSVSVSVRFPSSVLSAGASAALTLGGSYSGGTFSSAGKVTLP